MDIKQKILQRKARIAVIGLGYVGLPLAVEFAKQGFSVTGIDINPRKVRWIKEGRSYVGDVETGDLKGVVSRRRLRATADFEALKQQDAIIICVPTPLRKTKEPDISFILEATNQIAERITRGQLVVLESTTYPGTTEEMIRPKLEVAGFKAGRDFYLAFSPERVDPANKTFRTHNIPKVVGGTTPRCTEVAKLLYSQIVCKVIGVSSSRVAEMVKLLENTFRAVNIGLINEMCLLCSRLGVDVWEVIEAAKTKPFGFMPFYPGPGIGGECIPADPIYLSWKARAHGFEARFIELAAQINSYMPQYTAEKLMWALNQRGKSLKGARVLIVGVSYKKDVADTREAPAFGIINFLLPAGARIVYHDPYVPEFKTEDWRFQSVPLSRERLTRQDAVVIVTEHTCVDYDLILKTSPLIIDARNVYKGLKNAKVVRL